MKQNIPVANTKKQPLYDHNELVGNVCKFMATNHNCPPAVGDLLSCTPHDFTKAGTFQNYIYQKIDANESADNEIDQDSKYPDVLHHELGYALLKKTDFLRKVIHNHGYSETHGKWITPVLTAVYLHHPNDTRDENDTVGHILDNSKPEDIIAGLQYLKIIEPGIDIIVPEIINGRLYDYIHGDYDYDLNARSVPSTYIAEKCILDEEFAKQLLCTAILTNADRIVSSLSLTEFTEVFDCYKNTKQFPVWFTYKITASVIYPSRLEYTLPPEWNGTDRTNNQLDCVDKIFNRSGNTFNVNGPAGIGKTLIMILYAIREKKKITIVAPTNSIGNSIYRNIIEDLHNINSNLSVELYLTGKRQQCNNANENDFDSDILIINIDNLLSVFHNNSIAHLQFKVMTSTIFFDEDQVLLSANALFVYFINLVKARHRFTSSTTVLISATNESYSKFWDTIKKTINLPDDENHYPAQHKKTYIFKSFKDESSIDKSNTLIVYNNIKLAQRSAKSNGAALLTSKYTKHDQTELYCWADKHHGKSACIEYKNNGIYPDNTVVGTQMIRECHNISFNNLIEYINSPFDTVQVLGRINRFGLNDTANVYFTAIPIDGIGGNAGERGSCAIRWGVESNIHDRGFIACNTLRNLWYKELLKIVNIPITLDALYTILNKFMSLHSELVNTHLTSCYENGIDSLKKLDPKLKKTNNRIKADNVKITGKNLRNHIPGCFITMKYSDTDDWMDADNLLTTDIRTVTSIINNDLIRLNVASYMILLKDLADYSGWNYLLNKYKKRKPTTAPTLEEWLKFGRSDATPIPLRADRYNREVDPIKREKGIFGVGWVAGKDIELYD